MERDEEIYSKIVLLDISFLSPWRYGTLSCYLRPLTYHRVLNHHK